MATTAKEQITNIDLGEAYIDLHYTRNGIDSFTLTAIVGKDGRDITDLLQPSNFIWIRTSRNRKYDTEWNNRHEGVGRTITLSGEELDGRPAFECMLKNLIQG